jgi:hypothetical protein
MPHRVSELDTSFGTTFAMKTKLALELCDVINLCLTQNTCKRISKRRVKISGSKGYQIRKRGIESADDCTLFYGNGSENHPLRREFCLHTGITSELRAEVVGDDMPYTV